MSEHRDRKGLFKLLKSSNLGRGKPQNSTRTNSPVPKAAPEASTRSVFSNKIHDQRNFERKEQRDKLINQNRVRTNSVLSTKNTRTNAPQTSTTNSSKTQVSKPKPISKTGLTRAPSVNYSSKNSSNDSLSSTYSIDKTQTGSNLSRSSTISSANRKKLLDEWKKKKQEDEKLKPKKPAFKAGTAAQSASSKSSVPSSSTFNFSLTIQGSTLAKPAVSTAKKTLPPSSSRPPSSRPPVRSQSVRQTISKETPKASSINAKSRQTQVASSSKPLARKITEPNRKIAKPADLTKELDIITKKMNSSICLNVPKADALNETHLTTQPNHTSSPIKPKFNQEYFDNIDIEKRNVRYYRDLVLFSTDKLNNLSHLWTSMEQVPEEVQGDVRSACGLAKLLIDERFSQFSDLINQCEETENKQGGLVVKCSDLQGFWDMVDVQIKDVCKKFDFLHKLKSNNYVKSEDMVELIQTEVVAPKVFKPNRNYLRKKDQKEVPSEEAKVDEADKKPRPRNNKLAEFKAKMKAMKSQSDEIEIKIAEKAPVVKEDVKEMPKEVHESGKKTRRLTRQSVVTNDAPVEKKYNLRSRPSDLIKFDSPVATKAIDEHAVDVLTNSANFQSPIVVEKRSKKKSIYPVISEEDGDKENDDFFSLDDCPQVTWKTRPSIYPNGPVTPARQTPKRVSAVRESFAVASSPLLKLSIISAQSKRLSVNSLNRIFDKLE